MHQNNLCLPCVMDAFAVSDCLVKTLDLTTLEQLPLAVLGSNASRREYAFPNTLGLWVTGQGALDAAAFLARHLIHYIPQAPRGGMSDS